MVLGIFCTFILGTLLQQAGIWIGDRFQNAGTLLSQAGQLAALLMGAGIGAGVASRFDGQTFVVLSASISGMAGAHADEILSSSLVTENGSLVLNGPGEPLGAFLAACVAIGISRLLTGKTGVDLILAPAAGILGGSLAGILLAPVLSQIMDGLKQLINWGTSQTPFVMGIVIAVIFCMLAALPVNCLTLCTALYLSGPAAGAATIGCCCSMIGFAAAGYKDNGIPGLFVHGMGTSMLQLSNIIRRPLIWLPGILSSAILGPVGVLAGKMTNSAAGAGMGGTAFLGQITTWQIMAANGGDTTMVLIKILLLHVLLPGLLSLSIANGMRKLNLLKPGDMKLVY